MRYQYPINPKLQKRTSCFFVPMFLGILLFLIVEGYTMFVRSGFSEYIGWHLDQQIIGQQPAAQYPSQPMQPHQHLETKITSNVVQRLPTAIAVLPHGELTLTEERINTYLKMNMQSLAPLEQATVRFVPRQVQVDMHALHMQSCIAFGLKAQNGRVAVVNPQLSGPLGLVVSVDDVVDTLEEQINSQLATQGRSISDVQIVQGKLTVLIQ